jgi:hypothetical protein
MPSSFNSTRVRIPLIEKSSVAFGDKTVTTQSGFRGTRSSDSVGPAPTLSALRFFGLPPTVLDAQDGSVLFVPAQKGEEGSYTCYGKNEVSKTGDTTRFQKTGSGDTVQVTPSSQRGPKVDRYLDPSQCDYYDWERVTVTSVKIKGVSTGGASSEK